LHTQLAFPRGNVVSREATKLVDILRFIAELKKKVCIQFLLLLHPLKHHNLTMLEYACTGGSVRILTPALTNSLQSYVG
jgi:hypothetical protein